MSRLFLAFINEAKNCHSLYDIWALKVGGISIDKLYSGFTPRVGAVSIGMESNLFWLA
jgi:hypothetical protein